MMDYKHSPRIGRLMAALKASEPVKQSEKKLFLDMMAEVYGNNTSKPEMLRKAEFLTSFSERFPVSCARDELITGSMNFWFGEAWKCKDFYGNLGHMIVDYGSVLKKGMNGIKEEIGAIQTSDERTAWNKQSFRQTADAFSHFIERHAKKALQLSEQAISETARCELQQVYENCKWISDKPPRTFWEALQLVWFMQIFLHAEGVSAAISFGRFDQYLYPYYKHDMDSALH